MKAIALSICALNLKSNYSKSKTGLSEEKAFVFGEKVKILYTVVHFYPTQEGSCTCCSANISLATQAPSGRTASALS